MKQNLHFSQKNLTKKKNYETDVPLFQWEKSHFRISSFDRKTQSFSGEDKFP